MTIPENDGGNTVPSAGQKNPLAYTSLKGAFRAWLALGDNARGFKPEVIVFSVDRASKYALGKKMVPVSFWEKARHGVFETIYNQLLNAKPFRKLDKKAYKLFVVAGRLYLKFLQEKPLNKPGADLPKVPDEPTETPIEAAVNTLPRINPEDVIQWMLTQPNARGTLFLEGVARQYIRALSYVPKKLNLPSDENIDVFSCRTLAEFDSLLSKFKAASNFDEVNRTTGHGTFSSGLVAFRRYLAYISNGQGSVPPPPPPKPPVKPPDRDPPELDDSVLSVDFSRPELCLYKKPVSCTINGRDIALRRLNWGSLLVDIVEHLMAENNHRIGGLSHEPLYGNRVFLLPHRTENGNCAKLSNGKWLYINYSASQNVEIIGRLLRYCGISWDDVNISYVSYIGKTIPPYHPPPQATPIPPIILDEETDTAINETLSEKFSNGFRYTSAIEIGRLRKFIGERLGRELSLSDDALAEHVKTKGTEFDGKVYIIGGVAKERIKELAEGYFEDGAVAIFYEEFYSQNESWLFEASIVSDKMLKTVLQKEFPQMSFTVTYFGKTTAPVSNVIRREVGRVWGDDILLTYDALAERLKYIPQSRIKQFLGTDGDYIWNTREEYTHISKIIFEEQDSRAIISFVESEVEANGYVSMSDVPLGEIPEQNPELSKTAIHTSVHVKYLAERYDLHGKIVSRKGESIDALKIMTEHCRRLDYCALEDLLNYEKELTGESHRWISMQAGYAAMVRTGKNSFVADRHVTFDVPAIDAAIEHFLRGGEYTPLQSVVTFAMFPPCGHTWNLFLLESYCRRFSDSFRFICKAVNNRNSGAIVRKTCRLDYIEIMADALAKSGVSFNETAALDYFRENGYFSRKNSENIKEIINRARLLRK
jgi:hypothetical protein